MKALVEAALVGLERARAQLPDDPAKTLTDKLAGLSVEQTFLLRAGVSAMRSRAGRRPAEGRRPEPAPPETRPACSEALGELVAELCATRSLALLREALSTMDRRGQRLQARHLVALAELQDAHLMPGAGHVAGERGRWLAGQNPRWRWLLAVDPGSALVRKRRWEEGALGERLAVLSSARAEEPGEARRWIEEVWSEEKADVRERLLAALEPGLGPDDEPFLTTALRDRAAGVRAQAQRLLVRVPDSALATRMRQRAEGLLSYEAPSGVLGALGAFKAKLAGGPAAGTLTVSPPGAFPADWAADGLLEKAPAGKGEKAFWLEQVLSLVPPRHWEERFRETPDAVIAAASKTDWSAALLEGLRGATRLFRVSTWSAALWRNAVRNSPATLAALAAELVPSMTRADAEEAARAALGHDQMTLAAAVLPLVPVPWSHELGREFLASVSRLPAGGDVPWADASAWKAVLEAAALALPPESLAAALALGWPSPPGGPAGGLLRAGIDQFHRSVTIRHRIHQETRP